MRRRCRDEGLIQARVPLQLLGAIRALLGADEITVAEFTRRALPACSVAGATSFDGTSATRYAKTLPKLDDARRQKAFSWRVE